MNQVGEATKSFTAYNEYLLKGTLVIFIGETYYASHDSQSTTNFLLPDFTPEVMDYCHLPKVLAGTEFFALYPAT